MTIPTEHLRACEMHGVVKDGQDERLCPVCETDAVAKPGAAYNQSFTQEDLRWQMDHTVMIEFLELLVDWLDEKDEDPPRVAVAQIPKSELAAGYTQQERWFNVVQFEFQNAVHTVKHNTDAKEYIEQLRAGEDIVEEREYDYDRLDPEWWEDELEGYEIDIEGDRTEEDELILTLSGFHTDDHYSLVREHMGEIARIRNLKIYTLEAGGRWDDAEVRLRT